MGIFNVANIIKFNKKKWWKNFTIINLITGVITLGWTFWGYR
jgi:hypothetical protein